MKGNILLLSYIIILVFIISCDNLSDSPEQSGPVQYLATELGGCNGQDFNLKILIPEYQITEANSVCPGINL